MISGLGQAGRSLTCTAGLWSAALQGLGRLWLRNGVPIAGAVGQTYAATAADLGTALTCRVTPAFTALLTPASADSDPVAIAAPETGPPGAPGVKGDPGSKGATGAAGRPGRAAKVSCTVRRSRKATRVTCTVRYATGTARLRRHGATLARARVSGSGRLILRTRGRLKPGSYQLAIGTVILKIRLP